MADHFFSRWSRRKQEAAAGRPVDEPLAPVAEPAAEQAAGVVVRGDPASPQAPEPEAEPLPSMDDVHGLNPASDFQPFMRRGVTQDVRNAAMKKLFADPHFNVMDGLDIYIGDYTQADPLPPGMLQQMVGAELLGLVPPSAATRAQENPEPNPQALEGAPVVAQSPDGAASSVAQTTDHDHTDLQLQPDPAAADPDAGPRPR